MYASYSAAAALTVVAASGISSAAATAVSAGAGTGTCLVAAGMKKFETGLNGSLELMYENPGMQIWHVIPRDQLAAASAIAR